MLYCSPCSMWQEVVVGVYMPERRCCRSGTKRAKIRGTDHGVQNFVAPIVAVQ